MSLLEQDVNRETANGWSSFTFYKLLRFICMYRFAFKKKSYQVSDSQNIKNNFAKISNRKL